MSVSFVTTKNHPNASSQSRVNRPKRPRLQNRRTTQISIGTHKRSKYLFSIPLLSFLCRWYNKNSLIKAKRRTISRTESGQKFEPFLFLLLTGWKNGKNGTTKIINFDSRTFYLFLPKLKLTYEHQQTKRGKGWKMV